MAFSDAVTSVDALRGIYREPSSGAAAKAIDHIDDHSRAFIAHSPFVVVATSSPDGRCDVSPKGGPAGFVRTLDEHRLAFGDLSGNNRLDSFTNLVASSGIALLFCIPGLDETLRVNGRATLTTEPSVLEACALDGRAPRMAVGVDVEEAYIHCAKAFRRGGVWRPDDWPDRTDLPSVGCMLRDHIGLEATPEQVDESLERSYRKTLWEAGG